MRFAVDIETIETDSTTSYAVTDTYAAWNANAITPTSHAGEVYTHLTREC